MLERDPSRRTAPAGGLVQTRAMSAVSRRFGPWAPVSRRCSAQAHAPKPRTGHALCTSRRLKSLERLSPPHCLSCLGRTPLSLLSCRPAAPSARVGLRFAGVPKRQAERAAYGAKRPQPILPAHLTLRRTGHIVIAQAGPPNRQKMRAVRNLFPSSRRGSTTTRSRISTPAAPQADTRRIRGQHAGRRRLEGTTKKSQTSVGGLCLTICSKCPFAWASRGTCVCLCFRRGAAGALTSDLFVVCFGSTPANRSRGYRRVVPLGSVIHARGRRQGIAQWVGGRDGGLVVERRGA